MKPEKQDPSTDMTEERLNQIEDSLNALDEKLADLRLYLSLLEGNLSYPDLHSPTSFPPLNFN